MVWQRHYVRLETLVDVREKECQVGLSRQVSCLDWELSKDEMAELNAIKYDDVSPTPFSAYCPGSLALKDGKWVPRA